MPTIATAELPRTLPDHKQLPFDDGSMVVNFDEHPQQNILTSSIAPVLNARHPDGQYAIGEDCAIYWAITDPPLNGCKAPDWFYVPDVPPDLDGETRRSYVLWQEIVAPLIALELTMDDGSVERDTTPFRGKFWVYERAVRVPYYGIFQVRTGQLEMNRLIEGRYVRMEPNTRGHYEIPLLGVELGVWWGRHHNRETHWLRWWDADGRLLPTAEERAEQAQQQAEQAQQQAEQAQQQAEQAQQQAEQSRLQAERLAEKLRQLGVDPEKA